MVRGVRECEARTHRKGRDGRGTRLTVQSLPDCDWTMKAAELRPCVGIKLCRRDGEKKMQIPRLRQRDPQGVAKAALLGMTDVKQDTGIKI